MEKYLKKKNWLDNPILERSKNFTSNDRQGEEQVGGKDGHGQVDAQVVRYELFPEWFVPQVLDDLPEKNQFRFLTTFTSS